MRNIRTRSISFSLVLFAFALVFFSGVASWGIRPLHEAGRDLGRALDLLSGQMIWHGPEFRFGGYSPGPFLYWLTSWPMALAGDWRGALYLEIVLASLAAVVLFKIVASRQSTLAALFAFTFFVNGIVVFRVLNEFWNASYVFLFDVGLIGLLWSTTVPTPRRLLSAGAILGLILQMHALQALLLLDGIICLMVDDRLELRRRIKVCLSFVVGVVVVISPYLIWRLTKIDSNHSAWVKNVSEAPILEADVWGRLWSVFTMGLLQDVMLVAGLLVAVVGRGRLPKRPLFFFVSGVVTFVVFTKITLESMRYAIPLFLSVALLVASSLAELISRSTRAGYAFVGLCVVLFVFRPPHVIVPPADLPNWFFIAIAGLAAIACGVFWFMKNDGSRVVVAAVLAFSVFNFGYLVKTKADYHASSGVDEARPEDFERLFEVVKAVTGWSYDELRPRLYLTGDVWDKTTSLLYAFVEPSPSRKVAPGIEGVVALYRPFEVGPNRDPDFPADFKSAVESGRIRCVIEERIATFDVCFYSGELHRKFSSKIDPQLEKMPLFAGYTEPALRGSIDEMRVTARTWESKTFLTIRNEFNSNHLFKYAAYDTVMLHYRCEERPISVVLANQLWVPSRAGALEETRLVVEVECERPVLEAVTARRFHFYRNDRHIERVNDVRVPLKFVPAD